MFTNNAQLPYISVIAATNLYIPGCMGNVVAFGAGVSGATICSGGSDQRTLRLQPTSIEGAAPSATL